MSKVYLYILVMAGVTYLIRVLPLTIVRKEIKNVYIRSFFHYVPYVTLAVMIFPAILEATASFWSALAGFVTAILFSLRGAGLLQVALFSCAAVFAVGLFVYP
ncbi:MAG: AzlD domain-containing protein [Bacillales bacterium]